MKKVAAHGLGFLLLFAAIASAQVSYDSAAARMPTSAEREIVPAVVLRTLDLGLHSAVAAYTWVFYARNDLVRLVFVPPASAPEGYRRFIADFFLVRGLDPRWSTPYVFTLDALPLSAYPDRVAAAVAIGREGIAAADEDWRLPFYTGMLYHLELHDAQTAAAFFDLASRTPGIPEVVRNFALNYGVFPDARAQSKALWSAVYQTTDDELMKTRAKAYLERFVALDVLDRAVAAYKATYGAPPAAIGDLVRKGFIPAIPQDPFGFSFDVENGVAGFRAP